MRLIYVLLSSTFGMHQYTADLANRMAQAGHDVHLVTTAAYPAHRYLPAVTVHTPINTRSTGFSPEGLDVASLRRAVATTLSVVGGQETGDRRQESGGSTLTPDPRPLIPDSRPLTAVHLTGPHLWNLYILAQLRRAGVPVVHTLHDLDPHPGTVYGPLLWVWNRQVCRLADQLLVHGAVYRERLLAAGVAPARVTCTPLLHLFLGHTWLGRVEHLAQEVTYEPAVLFFGRLERYKGVDHLLTAWAMMDHRGAAPRLILAGPGDLSHLWAGPLPAGVEVRNHLIGDDEALGLFQRCGLLVLPYLGATQSALIPAAYFFRKPVIAAPSGALDEYVEDGETGWVVEPEHPPSLARCLTEVLADLPRLARMGVAGRAWYDARRAAEEATLHRMYAALGRVRPATETHHDT